MKTVKMYALVQKYVFNFVFYRSKQVNFLCFLGLCFTKKWKYCKYYT